jgi:uncharacterized protein
LKLHEQRATHLNTVTGYGPGYIEINRVRHGGNVIVAAASVQNWNVAGFELLRPQDFEPVLGLEPELVLLGTGRRHRFADPRWTAHLARAGIALEAMDTGAACRTYNILMSDGRRVVAALLQQEETDR